MEPLKRFLVLYGESYYPAGWDDFFGLFESLEVARKSLPRPEKYDCKYYQVIDLQTLKIVDKGHIDGYEEKRQYNKQIRKAIKRNKRKRLRAKSTGFKQLQKQVAVM